MKFNKHNSYREKNNSKPLCPKCHSSSNVVKLMSGWRCAYCDYKFNEKEQGGQIKLNV